MASTKIRWIPGPKQRWPWREQKQNSTNVHPQNYTRFGRSDAGDGPDAAVASRPHTPHVKDYPGLGEPNTLK